MVSVPVEVELSSGPPESTPTPARPPSRGRRLIVGIDAWFVGAPAEPSRSSLSAWLAFAVVPVFYTAYQLVTNGREIVSGGLWAELALTYYQAHDLPLLQQLLAGDAGYLPLPQRVLSVPLSVLGASAAVYPFYYSAVATLGAGVLVATLCLPTFRALIPGDGLRLVTAIALLVIADVNTRAFTNFVYFAAVPLVTVTALALAGERRVPRWAWILPLFMISKPALLAVVPVMVLVAILRSGRFRAITIASVVCAAAQVLYVSQQHVSLVDQSAPDYLPRTAALVPGYVAGFLGRWAAAPVSPRSGSETALVGVALVAVVALLIVKARTSALALVIVALLAAAISIVISTPVINAVGSGSAAITAPVPEMRDRLHIVSILGVVIVVAGMIAVARQALLRRTRARAWIRRSSAIAAIALFVAWFAVTGWTDRARSVAVQQGLPRMGTSQFLRLAGVLDTAGARACVPVDGAWILGVGCTSLVGTPIPDPNDIVLHGFRGLAAASPLVLRVPDQVRDAGLSSFAVMLRPADLSAGALSGRAVLTLADGRTVRWSAAANLDGEGGLLQFSSTGFVPVEDVRRIEVSFDRPVDLALTTASWQPLEQVHVLWMGQTPEMLLAR